MYKTNVRLMPLKKSFLKYRIESQMTPTLLICITCNNIFKTHHELEYHIKHDHQFSVKVKFNTYEIFRTYEFSLCSNFDLSTITAWKWSPTSPNFVPVFRIVEYSNQFPECLGTLPYLYFHGKGGEKRGPLPFISQNLILTLISI